MQSQPSASPTRAALHHSGEEKNMNTEIIDPHVDLPVIVARLRDRLRQNHTLSGSSSTHTYCGKLLQVYVCRNGNVELQRSPKEPDFKSSADRVAYEKEYADRIGPLNAWLAENTLDIGEVV